MIDHFGICTCNCLHHVFCILFAAFPILVYGPSVCHCHLLKVGQMPTSNPIENPAGTLLFLCVTFAKYSVYTLVNCKNLT